MPVLRHLSPSLTSDLGMTARSKGKKRAGAPYIPRPPNSFMLFRAQREADYKQNLRPGEPKLHQSELSREIGQAWRSLSPVARAAYQDEAARRAAEHKALYPDYVYRPETKEEKVARQKQEKEERAAATVARRAEKGRKRKGPEKPALTTTELSRPGTRDSTSPASATTDDLNTPTTTTSFSPPVSSPYDTRPSTAGPSTFSTTPATVIERYGDLGPTPAASCCTSYASSPSNEFALALEPAPLPRSDSSKQPSCGAASSGHQVRLFLFLVC
jgi:type II secretory pathway pseudopilin PulG